MKSKHFVFMLVMLLVSVSSFAQRRSSNPEERVDNHMERLSEQLELSDKQTADVRLIVENTHKEMQVIFEREKERRVLAKEEMDSIRSKQHAELKKLLSDEQIEKFEQMLANRPERQEMMPRRGHGKHRKHHHGDGHRRE